MNKRVFRFPRPRKRENEKTKRKLIIVLVLMGFFFYLFVFEDGGALDIAKQLSMKYKLQQEIKKERQKQIELETTIERISDSSRTYYLEKYIREKTGRTRKNEKVFRFD